MEAICDLNAEMFHCSDFDGRGPVDWCRREDDASDDIRCDYIAGCDGFHGISRRCPGRRTDDIRTIVPVWWLGILAERSTIAGEELLYMHSDCGFSLYTCDRSGLRDCIYSVNRMRISGTRVTIESGANCRRGWRVGWVAADRGQDPAKGHHGNAQLCVSNRWYCDGCFLRREMLRISCRRPGRRG